MSTTTTASSTSATTHIDPDECNYCGEEYPAAAGFDSRFCSPKCRYRGAAKGHLEALRRSHCYCASCFRQLKTIFHPGEFYINQSGDLKPTPEWFVGLEDAEPGYEWDIGEAFAAEFDPVTGETTGVHPAGEKSTKVCECGVTHHKTVAFGGLDTPGAPDSDAENFTDKLSLAELTIRAERLITFVEEDREWAVDHDALFAKLRALKTSEELSHKSADWLILQYALAAGLREATP